MQFFNKPKIIGVSSIAGPKESNGSINEFIETKLNDDMFGEDTFEKAESKMLYTVIDKSIKNANRTEKEIDAIVAGDLLNQIISSTFAARNFSTGYLGIYNACATFSESLILGATLVDGGYMDNVICASSSHFSSAERQYRYPLELGSTRPPQSQWTVTGAGASVISSEGKGPIITGATVGKIVDFGITDANNMGAAMAPAACDTLFTHFKDFNLEANDYDLIITGDLGALGSRIFKDLMWEKGYDVEFIYEEGIMRYLNPPLDIALILCAMFVCSAVFAMEHESGFVQILRLTSKGRKKMFSVKMCVVFTSAAVVSLLFATVDTAFMLSRFGVDYWSADIHSIPFLSELTFGMSIGIYTILYRLVSLIGCVLVFVIVTSLSDIMKSRLKAIIVAAGIIFIPFMLGTYDVDVLHAVSIADFMAPSNIVYAASTAVVITAAAIAMLAVSRRRWVGKGEKK